MLAEKWAFIPGLGKHGNTELGATSQRESKDILISPVTKWVVIGDLPLKRVHGLSQQ